MNQFKRLLGAGALAFAVLLGFGANAVEAGPFDGATLMLDLQVDSGDDTTATGKVNAGVVSIAPPSAGTLKIQMFLAESFAGTNIFNYNFEWNQTAEYTANFAVSQGLGILQGTGYLDPAIFGPQVGSYSVSGTPNSIDIVVPANGYIGTMNMTVKQDVPEGTTIALQKANVGTRGQATDSLNVSQAVLTFQQPAGPALSANPALAEIPRGGSASSAVTLSNLTAGDAIAWTITSGGPTVTVTGQSGLSFNTTAAAASEVITVNASGAGGTVTVAATVNGNAVTPVDIVFSEQVPAELAAFGGDVMDSGVRVNWTTTSQTNNAGWRVMRSTDGVNYVAVSELIPGAGTSDAVLPYSFFDNNPPQSEQVWYRLDQVDLDGTIHSTNAIEVILGTRFLDLPTEFATSVYPNPFNPATTVSYELPSEAAVSIVIYDALGQEIRRLVSEQKAAGRYTVQWDSRDNLGRSVGSGVYIAKVEAGSYSASQKMLLLK